MSVRSVPQIVAIVLALVLLAVVPSFLRRLSRSSPASGRPRFSYFASCDNEGRRGSRTKTDEACERLMRRARDHVAWRG